MDINSRILKAPSLKEQVYQHLKSAIINNQLDPHTVYSEKWAADLLGVSRTPVREAILQLKQEFFVDILPYKGFQIKELSSDDVKETIQIRQALEGFCVIRIAQCIGRKEVKELIARLEAILAGQQDAAQKGDINRFVENDGLFHMEIVNYSKNPQLIKSYRDIRSRFIRITLRVLTEPGRMETTVEEHLKVLDTMKQGKAWDAFLAVQTHLDSTQTIMEQKSAS